MCDLIWVITLRILSCTSIRLSMALTYIWNTLDDHLPQTLICSSLNPSDWRRVGRPALKECPVQLLMDSSSSTE